MHGNNSTRDKRGENESILLLGSYLYMWSDRKLLEGTICDKLKMNIINPRAATDKINKETLAVKGIGVQRKTKNNNNNNTQLHNCRKECNMA